MAYHKRMAHTFPMILLFFGILLLFGCHEKKEKAFRVGILSGLDYIVDIAEGFKFKMEELGYTEGKNIIYEMGKTNFEPDRERQIIEKYIQDKVDLIFTYPTEVSLAAKDALRGKDIPLLFAFANIETGLVDSVRQPGINITGVRYPGPDIARKRFEIMLELVPGAKRMLIPYQRGYPTVPDQMKVLRQAAESLSIDLLEIPASNAEELRSNLEERFQDKDIAIDAVLFIAEPLTVIPDAFSVIGKFASQKRIPVGGALISGGEYSSVFGVNVDTIKIGKQAAIIADKILKGAPAGKIPVISAESNFEINYNSAKQLGLNVSEGLLSQADRIIH
jgi:putative ABC transport system substrate-binding protein